MSSQTGADAAGNASGHAMDRDPKRDAWLLMPLWLLPPIASIALGADPAALAVPGLPGA